MATEEVEVAGKPVAEAVADEDATMQDALEAVPLTEAGLSADAMRASPMDVVEALLGMRSDGTICGYLQPSLAEISWQTLQETLSPIIMVSILHFEEHTTYCLRLSTATST